MGDVSQYWAFISYSHVDRKWARWLHRTIEGYVIHRHLVGRKCSAGTIPRKIRPIFRDREELPVSADLSASVRSALQSSHYLIVICSPDSARSRWVDQEVREFIALKGTQNILCVIAGDAPSGPRDVGNNLFPEALRVNNGGAASDIEPMAADLRREADGKRLAVLKLIAGMLEVGLDDLIQRDLHRRHRRMLAISAASVLGMALTGSLMFMALDSWREEKKQKAQAQALVEFMLGDLRSKLKPVSGLDTLASLSERTLQYYAAMEAGELMPDDQQRRARALLAIGEIEILRGNTGKASDLFEEAHKATTELMTAVPNDTARIFDQGQSVYWLGYIEYIQARLAEAETHFAEYLRLSKLLIKLEPGNVIWQKEVASAHTNLGVLQLVRGEMVAALHSQMAARDILQQITKADPDDLDSRYLLANTHAWLADVEEGRGNNPDAFISRGAQMALLEGLRARDPGNTTYIGLMVSAARKWGRLLVARGDFEEAERQVSRSVEDGRTLVKLDPSNAQWLEITGLSIRQYADMLLWQNRIEEAAPLIAEAGQIANRLIEQDDSVLDWQVGMAVPTALLRSRLLAAQGDPKAALEAVDDRIDQLRSLLEKHPDNIAILSLLAGTYLQQGDLEAALDRRDAARDSWHQVVAVLQKASMALPLVDRAVLARGHLRLDQFDQAAVLTSELEKLEFRHPMMAELHRRVGSKGAK